MLPPLRFRPLIKRLRWGGTRLGTMLGKPIGTCQDAAESWDIVDHGSDQSVVATGPFADWTLAQLIREHGSELIGASSKQTSFPLLVKFLDAQDRLSLQVHPNDVQAKAIAGQGRGKTEAWVILEAQAGSLIYCGLLSGVQQSDLEAAVQSGNLSDCVHTFEAHAGDCILIPAGTVHAIGEGILLAEIQQTSDTTYRLYDWGRLGTDGQPRQLHLRKALECTDFERGPVNPLVPRVVSSEQHHRIEDLVACDYFSVRRHQGSAEWGIQTDDRFHIVMVLEGRTQINWSNGSESLATGDTILIPASRPDCQVSPKCDCTILEVFVPH